MEADKLSIAIVGMAGRFPGAENVDKFWNNLQQGKDAVRFFSTDELEPFVPRAILDAPNFLKAGYVLDDVDMFDADFFGISQREAGYMDPQHRLFLECAWEAMENAGYVPGKMTIPVGVYASAAISTYLMRLGSEFLPWVPTSFFDVLLGNDKDYLATRVCYKLGLTGPGVMVQSACSSSLVAVSMACQGLLEYQTDMALAGGICLTIPQKHGYLCVDGDGFLSPDAKCRAFDAGAAGTVQGNGVGVVVLKRLEDALAQGDSIHAVIRGFAINNDGSDKAGFTAPSLAGQRNVIREAMAMADVQAENISYIETHGTGTALGDPLEISALTDAFGKTSSNQYCPIGSVKTNIGHLNTAAGVASLIKVALSLRHEQIPPSLHFERPNPAINFAQSPFYVNTRLQPWESANSKRIAGVSSFGFGGTNVHMIVEEAPVRQKSGNGHPWRILPLSARSESALAASIKNLRTHLAETKELALGDVAHTLQMGRKEFPYRAVVSCRDISDAIDQLDGSCPICGPAPEAGPAMFFLLPGQGACPGMTASLYKQEGVFRQTIDQCARIMQPLLGADICEAMTAGTESREEFHAVPTLCAVQIALAKLWQARGIVPAMLMGQGAGLYAGAALAGILSLEEVLLLAVAYDLEARGQSLAGIEGKLQAIAPRMPQIPLLSPVTGNWITAAEASSLNYWLSPEHHEVDLLNGLTAALQKFSGVVLEIGVSNQLLREKIPGQTATPMIAGLPGMGDTASEDAFMTRSLGELWRAGASVDWACLNPEGAGRRVPLPTYPFERKRFFLDRPLESAAHAEPSAKTENKDTAGWFYAPTWKRQSFLGEPKNISALERHTWLVFMNDGEHGKTIDRLLRQMNQDVIQIWKGNAFARLGQNSFSIRPAHLEDYASLFTLLTKENCRAEYFLHLWNVDMLTAQHIEPLREHAYDSLICLVRALDDSAWSGQQLRLGVLSTNTHAVLGDEEIVPEKALLLGPCLVAPQEFPGLTCLAVDLPEKSDPASAELHLKNILADLLSLQPKEDTKILAYRGKSRWERHFQPVHLKPQVHGPRLRHGGVYLISGGFGGLGSVMAEFLAREYQARLVLVGRSPLPEREQWEAVAQCASDAQQSSRAKQLLALKKNGAQILALSCDVADEAAMQKVFAQAVERFGDLDGVIHAAGVVSDAAIKNPAETKNNMRPKVLGSAVLHRLCEAYSPDFLLLCSSLAAVGGLAGSSDYTASNNVLDARAYCQRTPLHCVSVNWNYWLGTGMSKQSAVNTPQRDRTAIDGLTPEQGIYALQRILESGLRHVAVCTKDLTTFLHEARQGRPTQPDESVQQQDSGYPRPDIDVPYIAPRTVLEHTLSDIWKEVLELADVGIDDPFLDIGGDSLSAIKLDSRLREVFSMKLPLNALFTHDTVAKLAKYLTDQEEEKGLVLATAELFQQVKNMSQEEIRAALNSQDNSRS